MPGSSARRGVFGITCVGCRIEELSEHRRFLASRVASAPWFLSALSTQSPFDALATKNSKVLSKTSEFWSSSKKIQTIRRTIRLTPDARLGTSAMQSPDEIFDVCDAEDRVIGQARRTDVHARNLLHRAVHVWVFRTNGQLVAQRRSASKDQYPLTLTSSASGHLDSGEGYLAAAIRELGEELGLHGLELTFAVKLPASLDTAYEHTVLYTVTTDAPLFPHAGEVAGLEMSRLEELQAQLVSPDSQFSPPFRKLLEWAASCPAACLRVDR